MNEWQSEVPDLGPAGGTFRHEALLYAGPDEFVAALVPYLREGLAAGETTAALLEADKIALLREALGADADRVHFTDAAEVGRNPARLIPWWRRFLDQRSKPDQQVRAVEEPDLSRRIPAELDEYLTHEALLNVAFADDPPWSLLCSYDVDVLSQEIVDECRRHHPFVGGVKSRPGPNSGFQPGAVPARQNQPLTPPPADAHEIGFERERGALRRIRDELSEYARRGGLDATATEHLVLAVNELVSNSMNHAGGTGTIRLWQQGEVVVCEVSDDGRLTASPLLGREHPPLNQPGGRGLWMVNQLCDLVQVRALPAGTTVRLHMWPSTT